MNRIKKAVTFCLGLVILATAAALISGANLKASTPPPIAAATITSLPVAVTNTPLPVTGSVNIGTPTVNVGSLPAVQLSGTPAVSFTNTANTPIYVDTDRPPRATVLTQPARRPITTKPADRRRVRYSRFPRARRS